VASSTDLSRLASALADRYRIERELGQGGMATVYLARDIRHDRDVALKVLHPDLAATIGPERFLAEIRVTAHLQHPNILGLFDSGVADGQAFYVMPYVTGESLRDRLAREKQLPVADALRISAGVASALEYAHAHGVIHRDIKPENVLLQSGQAVVADFGIALAVQQAGGQRLTQTGLSLGTPQYMSPEQAMGERTLDARTDIYALGVITYEMLAGEPPFTGPNAQAIVSRVLTEKPRPLSQIRETVPPHVAAAVHQAMQKLPADRFATASAFAAALETPVVPQADVHRAAETRAGRGSWHLWAGAAAMAVVFLGAGYLAGRRSESSSPFATDWQGELLGGPQVAMTPAVSRDGQSVAFQALVDGLSQVAVIKPQSGDWKVLTNSRTQGLVASMSWARDNSRIYFDRFLDVPTGIYSISPLGGDERLVLAGAVMPDVLPDGSLLVARLNSSRELQMYRYWPEKGRLDTLGAVGTNTLLRAFYRAFPNGTQAVFVGRPAGQKDSASHFYALDLATNQVTRLAFDADTWSFFSVTPDNRWLIVGSADGAMQRVVAVPTDGSNNVRTIARLTSLTYAVDATSDGSIYFDQYVRPMSLRTLTPATGRVDIMRLPRLGNESASPSTAFLPLPDGRTLMAIVAGSTSHVMVVSPGHEPATFMLTGEQTTAPLTLLGPDQVAMSIGTGANQGVVIAAASTGQLIRRLPGIVATTLAGAPDGKTLYFSRGGAIWAMPSTGGEPRRIHEGDAVAVDPAGRYLLVQVADARQVRLVHVPLDGTSESEVAIRGEYRLPAGIYLSSNAIGRDGRIIVEVIPPASWFWPAAILDPKTGSVTVLPPGSTADMRGGWSPDGRIVYFTQDIQSELWRFRPPAADRATR
jgi:hypothetical protein